MTMGSAHFPVNLRAAKDADLATVLALLEEAGLPKAGVEESFGTFVVAETEGHLVGVAGLEVHGGDGILRSVAVRPSYQGSGLGRRLTERILETAGNRGLGRVFLLTTTAEEFFLRHGFRPVERTDASPAVRESVEFREACPASAVAMLREL